MKTLKQLRSILFATLFMFFISSLHAQEWVSLFDGKSLDGWKVGDNASTFRVDSGMIIVNGNTAHLFYDGAVHNHNFKNFELKADVLTKPHSNSGIYFSYLVSARRLA